MDLDVKILRGHGCSCRCALVVPQFDAIHQSTESSSVLVVHWQAHTRKARDEWWRALRLAISNAGAVCICKSRIVPSSLTIFRKDILSSQLLCLQASSLDLPRRWGCSKTRQIAWRRRTLPTFHRLQVSAQPCFSTHNLSRTREARGGR